MIRKNIVKANVGDALPLLEKKLNGYRYAYNRVYIGATSNPDLRWAQHAPAGWDMMVLLYEAYTPGIAINIEQHLIQYAHACGFIVPIENVGAGGEGIGGSNGLHYIYVLVGRA